MKYLELLFVIVVLCGLCAWRAGRPVKLFLTQDEASYWRSYWWKCARRELKAWLICFPLLYMMLVAACNGQDWGAGVHLAVVGISLLAFSRLAIWLVIIVLVYGFIGGSISHYALGVDFPVWIFPQISVILALVIVFRIPFFFLFVWRWSAMRSAPHQYEGRRVIDI